MAKQDLEIEIGLAQPKELDAIWALYQRTYLDTYTDDGVGITRKILQDFLESDFPYFPKNWESYLEKPSKERTVYVAKHIGEIVGMVAPVFVDGKHRITALYVAPEAQHMRVGTHLMEAALAHHGDVDVYVGIASYMKELQHFYEPFGFKVEEPNKLRKYPPDPMSYIDMVRRQTTG